MNKLLLLIIILIASLNVGATNFNMEDTAKVQSGKWYCPHINWKEAGKQFKFFGKSSDPSYHYNKFLFDVGIGPYNNPTSDKLQHVFVINGYSGLAAPDGLIGNLQSIGGSPAVYGQKALQFHVGFGYSINKFLTFGIEFRGIPATYTQGYIAKLPYDYANPDMVQESANANCTQYKISVLVLTFEQNHKKLFDLSVGAAMVHYTFDIQTQLNINQYDTTSNLQIVGQSNIENFSKVWGQAFNAHLDIYFTKYLSLQLAEDYFINVLASVPTVEYDDYPYSRVVKAHTLNYLNFTFSGALAFHF
jgi:hypothetical protein